MAEKEKSKQAQTKNIPKDGQVITAIMKEMGITEYEPKTIVQLMEFVYRYATSILEEARMYANNSNKKKTLDTEDIHLALQLTAESTFTTPPPREVVLECASVKNYTLLPTIKPHCGLRLPPDRYCLASCNYTLKYFNKMNKNSYGMSGNMGMKPSQKSNVSFLKRSNPGIVKQTVSIAKPVTKISASPQMQKTVLKPKIQITQNIQVAPMSSGGQQMSGESLKRKREDDDLQMM